MSAAGLIVGAPASGSGKTTITLALLRAFRRQGLAVGSFKVGPDYIDPAFHARASGRPCPNLDAWAMRIETLAGLADRLVERVDLVLGEGVMGLFDGAADGTGSTADLASLLDLPVILVVDASRMGGSAAALVEGFTRHRDDVEVAGVVFNRVAGERHAAVLRRACDDHFAQPVLGCVPPSPDLRLPERHLGLLQAQEVPDLERWLDAAADMAARHLDLDRLQRLARPFGLGLYGPPPRPLRPLGQRIALARDAAFAFAYPATIEGWREAGAEILPFSPLSDQGPDTDADAVFLPGGYPELHAGRLAANRTFLDGLRETARHGTFVYGECGGFMALGTAGGSRGPLPCHGRAPAGGHQLRRAAAASRLSTHPAFGGEPARPGRRDLPRARVPLRVAPRGGRAPALFEATMPGASRSALRALRSAPLRLVPAPDRPGHRAPRPDRPGAGLDRKTAKTPAGVTSPG